MDLEAKYGHKYRVYVDEAYKHESTPNKSAEKWRYLELRGKYGYVYPYSSTQLAVAITGPKIANRLAKRPNWKIIQNGDDVIVFLVPPEDISVAFSILKLARKKVLSDAAKERLTKTLEKARAAKKS